MLQFIICLLLLMQVIECSNLYSILGISRDASVSEIKKAYRTKARISHPDKNPGVDIEEATRQFRLIAEAYEVLSDEKSKRTYDSTENERRTRASSGFHRQQSQEQRFNDFFFRNRRQQQSFNKNWNVLYRNPNIQRQVKASQSRVLSITGMAHMRAVVFDEDDNYNGLDVLERFVLLAVYDTSIPDCSERLDTLLMYPWPFAGFTREGDRTMWWEETLVALKLDLNNVGEDGLLLASHLGIQFSFHNGDIPVMSCPAVAMFSRKGTLNDYKVWSNKPHEGEFRDWVWGQLQMTFWIVNKTPWTLNQWWLDGTRGMKREDLLPGARFNINTYLSHAFIFRPSFVGGNALNNESSVFWYTSRIEDDGQEVVIYPRCFDNHGDCPRWAREGFCDPNSRMSQRDSDTYRYVRNTCVVSCEIGCSIETIP